MTEGQAVLKEQYLDELKNANVELDFTFGEFGSNAQVQVGLPQSIGKLKGNDIDLLIVDEGHNFYFAPTIQNILKNNNVRHQLIMTGSPSEYNFKNETMPSYGMTYISAEDLENNNVFSSVHMEVFKTENRTDPKQTVKDLMAYASFKALNTDKMMIAAPTIDFANKVKKYLESTGRIVSLSTSENDKENEQINKFKNNETDVLIVVNKGILGFNDKNITFLADLKSSGNLDTSNQLFSRVLRRHPSNLRKTYIRASTGVNDFNKQVVMLHKIAALMKRKFFQNYNGKNIKVSYNFS